MTDHRPIRVLCIDDNIDIATLLSRAIDRTEGMTCVGMAHRADRVLHKVAELAPDVLIVDAAMPGRDPLEVIRELARTAPQARAIVFSGFGEAELVDRAVECGAWGFVVKDTGLDQILEAIRQVAGGHMFVPSRGRPSSSARPRDLEH